MLPADVNTSPPHTHPQVTSSVVLSRLWRVSWCTTMERYGMPTDSFSSCGTGRTGWMVASWSFSSSPASNPLTLPSKDGFTLTPLTRGRFTHEALVCINRNSDPAYLTCTCILCTCILHLLHLYCIYMDLYCMYLHVSTLGRCASTSRRTLFVTF